MEKFRRQPPQSQTLASSSVSGDKEEDYGLIRPSLIRQLRSILEQYPDDGQILKELIQNAEDAGAREVLFLYDQHEHNTHRLHHPDMAKFQGPALFSHNDALFDEKDWTGIRMLQDSIKEKDPMKVGRFGLGFKSVLHMTDLPSVISADRLFIIDPHEKYFQFKGDRTSGYSWHLKQKQAEMKKIPDQFQPYTGLYGCTEAAMTKGYYKGTLFRFPLRSSPSELSSTLYNKERMLDLFHNFEADAHLTLLFLKHLEKIELHMREKDKQEIKAVFKVEIASKCLEYVRKKRAEFLQQLHDPELKDQVLTTSYAVFIETHKYTGQEVESKTYKYLLNEYRSGQDVSIDLRTLQKDPVLSLVPLVGVAMEVGKKHEDVTPVGSPTSGEQKEDKQDTQANGQVFCFLPLPVERKSSSGLPVHVNGYFAVSQNRRHLKWPTAAQNIRSDKSLLWNQCLLQEVVPLSYAELLSQATIFNKKNPGLVSPLDIYNAMPNLVVVDERWMPLLPQLYSKLFLQPLFHTELNNGSWILVQDCVFDCLKETLPTRAIIKSMLLKGGVSVAEVPMHLLHALGAFSMHSPEVITPAIVRNTLRDVPVSDLSRANKLLLLQYILKDEDFRDLDSIALLPTADGAFTLFSQRYPVVYIPSVECPRTLLPGQEKSLIAEGLEDIVMHKLVKMADEGFNQVRQLDKDSAAALIPQVIPKAWHSQQPFIWDPEAQDKPMPPADWLQTLWEYLRRFYPSDISRFSGLPILPLNKSVPLKLVPLSMDTPAIFSSAIGVTLPAGVVHILELMGVYVVEELPQYVRAHAAVVGNFVSVPVPEDVVHVLFNAYKAGRGSSAIESVRVHTTAAEKNEMLDFLSKLQLRELTLQHSKFLRSLPLFKSSSSTTEKPDFVSVAEVNQAAPVHKLPVEITAKYLDVSSDAAKRVAKLFGATFLSMTSLLRDTVLTDFRQGRVDREKAEKVTFNIFTNFHKYTQEDPGLPDFLSTVPFVVTEKGRLEKPSNLCDPSSEALKEIFLDEDLLPGGLFAAPENLVYLKRMGIKSVESVTAKDVLHSIIHTEDMTRDQEKLEDAATKARAILLFLGRKSQFLYDDVNGRLLVEWAMDVQWIPTLQEKPSLFPAQLSWYSSSPFLKPGEVKSPEWMPLLGSVHAIVKFGVSQQVAQAFGWDAAPSTSMIVSHLVNVISSYDPEEKAKFLAMLISVYDALSDKEPTEVLQSLVKCKQTAWIWHGDGFARSQDIVLTKPHVDLVPFVYALPSEMTSFSSLFQSCGMPEFCTSEKLVSVLHQIKAKHSPGEPTDADSNQEHDLQLVIDILNHLARESLQVELLEEVLIPCQMEDENEVQLLPISHVTYCDVEWVRQGFDLMEFDKQDGVIFIHPNLPVATAEHFGVPTLMSRMLHAEELAITGFGQSEPLTDRLRRLLEDYTDGLAIPKELVQNADDAGATEVKLLFDERTNTEAMKYLIDEGMRECQGPAIWAHNNAVFTDKDFQNITKLGGETKAEETDKIGKFGLGFNAVYNLTDVPSFVSRNNLVIFDPHTTHLGRGIKDKTKPGIKIDLKRNKTLIRKLPDQFKPYEAVFGCKIASSDNGYYPGTLFRLPLRTKSQAAKSEISSLHYDKSQVEELLKMLSSTVQNMLLFTQNVSSIGVYHLEDGADPKDAKLIFEATKDLVQVVRSLQQGSWAKQLPKDLDPAKESLLQNSAVLKAASEYMSISNQTRKHRTLQVTETPRCSIVLHTCLNIPDSDSASCFKLEMPEKRDHYWFVCSCMGQGEVMKMAKESKEGLLPMAGVVVALHKTDNGFMPVKLTEVGWSGRAFCYLPLPVQTGLPVHINGQFAVQSNRRQLSEQTEDDKQNLHVEWNCALLQDAVGSAYIQMLHDVKEILPKSVEVKLYEIWPSQDDTERYFFPLVSSFYRSVTSLLHVPLYHNGSELVSLTNVMFLSPDLGKSKKVESLAIKVFAVSHPGQAVITIPKQVLASFEALGLGDLMTEKTYGIRKFFKEVFLPNIHKCDGSIRDPLILFAFQQNNQQLDRLLAHHECIPTSPDGKTLSKPSDLIHPSGLASKLFAPEDGRFPYGEAFSTGIGLTGLQRLGLKVNDVPWEDVLSATKQIEHLADADPVRAQKQQQNVFFFIDRKVLQSNKSIQSYHKDQETQENMMQDIQNQFREIPFLPLMEKPEKFPVKWLNSDYGQNEVMCPCELYTKDLRYLVSSTQPIVNEEGMNSRVKDFLGLSKRKASLEQVITQMEHALNTDPSSLKDKEYEELLKVMYSIYNFLQDQCALDSNVAEQIAFIMKGRPCILVSERFLKSEQLAFNFPHDCDPYLFGVPHDVGRRYGTILKLLGVKEKFEVGSYTSALQHLKSESGEKPLKQSSLDLSVRMVTQLNSSMKEKKITADEVEKAHGTIYVPNANGVLKPSATLCYNDCPWVTETSAMNFTHPDITYRTSACLGVKTKRQEALSKHAQGIPFGQKERLTNSLRRILSSYPCDHEILKELIQNADDAQATEIHFIRDPRHHSDKHVFENSWKPLQGPALCVYNNMPFTLADLEGIQRLGEGSKAQDPSKTGQYGIGFSSVYHLTDAPTVFTSGPDLGKTLCIFDPLCLYAPGATPAEPGIRYDDIDNLKTAFPDVFNCYLEDQFEIEQSTMFRFPLRNNTMAERSEISKTPMSPLKLQNLLDMLRKEAFEILLFTNYIEQISISDIDPVSGQLVNTYTVKAMLSKEHRKARTHMAETVRAAGKKLKLGETHLKDIEVTEAYYNLFITDNRGNQEKWSVTHRLGFGPEDDIPNGVNEAVKAGELALLPRGSTACLLEKRLHGKIEMPSSPQRVFCFLPLPVETDLPVHINGHFALGYENRRHIWTSEKGGFKREWNDLLCSAVISKAYLELLKIIRMQGLNSEFENDEASVFCSRSMLDGSIKAHQAFFPHFSDLKPEWDVLVFAVYQHMAKHNVPILPAIKEVRSGQTMPDGTPASHWKVSWLPPKGEGNNKAFFSKLEKEESGANQSSFFGKFKTWFKTSPQSQEKTDSQILKDVLLDSGFKLLEASAVIVENLQRCGIDVDYMSPSGVLMFFRSYSTESPMCCIGDLPTDLSKSVFRNERTLDIVMKYCQEDPGFNYKLDGLPMLLTQDNVLRVFDSDCPALCSRFYDLVPQCSNLFLKDTMREGIFKNVNFEQSIVFTPMTIRSLADILHFKLPQEEFCGRDQKQVWMKAYASLPNETWMRKLWTFLKSQLEDIVSRGDLEKEQASKMVAETIEPLADWSLIPAKTASKNYLLPIKMGHQIIDFKQSEYKYYGVKEVLRRLQLPELDSVAINTDLSYNIDVARALVTTLDKPSIVLSLLHENVTSSASPVLIGKDECMKLLRYFSENIEVLSKDDSPPTEHQDNEEDASFEDDPMTSTEQQPSEVPKVVQTRIDQLRELPLYTTIYGDTISLTDCFVYTLPAKIPTNGIDVWQSKSGTVFLERNDTLQALYDFLGCAKISILDVYCKFIFQHFEYFPPEDRMVHLYHVYKKYIREGTAEVQLNAEEKETLIDALRDLSFIENADGELQSANQFYDPENLVFKIMLPEDKFPPRATKYFKESEWYAFLGQLGLVRDVTRTMFMEFTQQVAHEGRDPSSASALTKSKVLASHLYQMSSMGRNDVLHDIATVPFIAPEPASKDLVQLFPQHGDIGNNKLAYVSFRDSVSKEHEKLVWTKANILPTWADPMKQHNLPQQERVHIMECLEVQKVPSTETVLSHLSNLCDTVTPFQQQSTRESIAAKREVFKAIYRYFQEKALDNEEVITKLQKTPCILVSNGTNLVLPSQTTFNIFDADELRPYLYKVPVEFGEFQSLFRAIGTTDRATVNQYASVLQNLHKLTGFDRLNPNEMKLAFKTVKGLLDTLEISMTREITVNVIYLPSEMGRLVDATKLVFNDAPSFYDRVSDFGLQFLFDLKECGFRSRNVEDLLQILPARLRPGMLSAFVKESLVDSMKDTITKDGVAATLNERLKSEAFSKAVARLIRHEAHRRGRKLDDHSMFNALERLSIISVFGVKSVQTHLTFKGRPIAGSEVDKTCFVESVQVASSDLFIWNVYIKNNSSMSQDLLIPLAEVINSILGGLLRDSVLYLLPIIACSEEDIQARLNSLNVRMDHSQVTTKVPTLSPCGTQVPESHKRHLVSGESDFHPGEYVAYQETPEAVLLYAEVKEEIMSPEDCRVYLVDVGGERDSVIAPVTQLLKFVRK